MIVRIRHSLISLLFLSAGTALAAGGTVSGTLYHYNLQGNYCPSTRNCTGAKYLESEFNNYQPVPNTKVYVRDTFNGAVLGQGSSDLSGNFNISWFSPWLPAQIQITWHAEHNNGAFNIYDANGVLWTFWTWGFAPVDGGNVAIGGQHWGSAGGPLDVTNVYDGAFRTWWDSLWWSAFQRANFLGLRVYTGSTVCPTSCEQNNEIWLDPGAAYAPQARIMHEMGHRASEVAGDYMTMVDYCWPSTGNSCGWNLNTAEWRQPAMEEAFATWVADAGLYYPSAIEPHSCIVSQAPCGTGAFNLESSSGFACGGNEDRFPITYDRIFWDIYDSRSDCVGTTCDNISVSISSMHTVWGFPGGTGDGQRDEGWSCFIWCWISDRDARNIVDYTNRLAGVTGVSGVAARNINCN